MSIAPETKIERHGVIPPLPSVPVNNCKDNVSSPTDDKDVTQVASQQKGENPESSAPESVVKVPGKKGRKPKVATESKEKKNKKVLPKKKDDNIARDSASVNEDQEAEVDDKYAVNSKVFARWGDSTGVYFYPAVITQIINNEQVKVTFLEDKIKKPPVLEKHGHKKLLYSINLRSVVDYSIHFCPSFKLPHPVANC